jgi:hypothetical protein
MVSEGVSRKRRSLRYALAGWEMVGDSGSVRVEANALDAAPLAAVYGVRSMTDALAWWLIEISLAALPWLAWELFKGE